MSLFDTEAKRVAEERAKKGLLRQLDRAVDPVPCPYCGVLQPNMFRKKSNEKTKTLLFFGAVILAIVGVVIYEALRH